MNKVWVVWDWVYPNEGDNYKSIYTIVDSEAKAKKLAIRDRTYEEIEVY